MGEVYHSLALQTGDGLALQCVFQAAAVHDRSFDGGACQSLNFVEDITLAGGVDVHVGAAQAEGVHFAV